MSSGVACSGSGCGSPSISIASPPCSFCFALAHSAVDAHLPGFDQQLHPRPADLRNRLRQVGVQPHSRRGGVGHKRPHAVLELGILVEIEHGHRTSGSASTPRVARYSARTDCRRWPLGSMFLEGIAVCLKKEKKTDPRGRGVKRW